MATLTDKAVGTCLISLALLIFLYYTLWVMVLLFVDESHVLHSWFLPRWYATLLPLVAGVTLLAAIGVFVGVVLVKDNAKKRKKKAS